MSVPRNHAFSGVVNGKIYVIGGRTGHGFILSATNTDVVEEYNPINDSWSVPKERMPTARSGGASGSDGRRIYAAGGEVTTKDLVGAFKSVEAYDPVTNSWMTLPSMPMPRHGIAGAVIGNRFHLVSGMMQSAGALTFLDPTLSTHTAMHDILVFIGFYNDVRGRGGRGGENGRNRTRNANVARGDLDPLLARLNVGGGRRDLVAFLEALSDPAFDRTVPSAVPSGLPVGGRIM